MYFPTPYPTIQSWKSQCRSDTSSVLVALPKVELHVHLEGTLTPSLRFKFAQRNNIPLYSSHLNKDFHSSEGLQEAYDILQQPGEKGDGPGAFFAAYEDGMEVLRTGEDFHELAMAYFERAKQMGVRYAEVMVDIQRHTRRGVEVEVVMDALRTARDTAEKRFKVSSGFTELENRLT